MTIKMESKKEKSALEQKIEALVDNFVADYKELVDDDYPGSLLVMTHYEGAFGVDGKGSKTGFGRMIAAYMMREPLVSLGALEEFSMTDSSENKFGGATIAHLMKGHIEGMFPGHIEVDATTESGAKLKEALLALVKEKKASMVCDCPDCTAERKAKVEENLKNVVEALSSIDTNTDTDTDKKD